MQYPITSLHFLEPAISQMNSSTSPIFDSDGEFDCGFGSAFRNGSNPKSAAPVRPRVRLSKVRKPLNGKVRGGLGEVGSDFNPFKQSVQGWGLNNGSDRDFSGNVEIENENDGFVFEANLGAGMKKLISENFGFVFGANGSDGGGGKDSNLDYSFGVARSGLESNWGSGKVKFNKSLNEPDCSDAGFVFGSSQRDSNLCSNSDRIEPTVFAGETIFGPNLHDSSSFHSERGESGKSFRQQVSGYFGKMNMEGETESRKMEPAAVNFNVNGRKSCVEDCVNDFFVFGATSGKGSFSNECEDGIKSSSGNFGVSVDNSCCEKVPSPLKNAPEGGPSQDWSNNGNVNDAVSYNSFNIEKSFQGHVKDDVGLNKTDACASLNLNSQVSNAIDLATVGIEKNNESCSTGNLDQLGTSSSDFKTPECDLSSFKAHLFTEVDEKLDIGLKSGLTKEKRVNKMRGKSKKSYLHKLWSKQQHVLKESNNNNNNKTQFPYVWGKGEVG
ncbi:hypothetical protein F3Y22_tig00110839pilonHSYRG00072 [Hibiscus syriacus]|uniref:Uncharacterized protein n=1 Tax=Hibiscus syriacus TaxID=106335 RepID=A0A6A2ZKY9_HIBSY|nr:hypothetical protein F3Y22_tig00110839pilonHSYRG00072 [Hibiscus syriacus]